MKTKILVIIILAAVLLSGFTAAPATNPVRHQGGDALDWSIPGTNNYQAACTLRQNGAILFYSPTPVTSGDVFVTYPLTYGGGRAPLVIAGVTGATADVTVSVVPLFAGARIYWKSAAPRESVQFAWSAEGVCP